MAKGRMQKLKESSDKKRPLAKSGNLDEKIEKMKVLQVQNKSDIKKANTGVSGRKKGAGRNVVITEGVLQLLKTAFAVGMTDEEACYFCQVSTSAFYAYQRNNKKFMEEKKLLKKSMILQSKMNIAKSIKDGNVEDSKWWLIKKDPEFKGGALEGGLNVQINNIVGMTVEVVHVQKPQE